jgi:transposase-like protein
MSRVRATPPMQGKTEHPSCPKCGARMWLVRSEPDKPGHDKRTFQCPTCERSVVVAVMPKEAG